MSEEKEIVVLVGPNNEIMPIGGDVGQVFYLNPKKETRAEVEKDLGRLVATMHDFVQDGDWSESKAQEIMVWGSDIYKRLIDSRCLIEEL